MTVRVLAGRVAAVMGANVTVDLVILVARWWILREGGRARRVSPVDAWGQDSAAGTGGAVHVVFVSFWSVAQATLWIVAAACCAVMFVRGAFLLEACGP
ncbi:hypothetical protein DFJ73DRAFT_863832 [Zopfochytrium polystomum]|nr:hypothetical protein DFJ73DRAFT_863832 [Zopfochytrium polystomum]